MKSRQECLPYLTIRNWIANTRRGVANGAVLDSYDPLVEAVRLRAVEEVLKVEMHREYDRLSSMAADILSVPVCLVSLVTDDRQIFRGACGLPGELDEIRETPLSHSMCAVTVRSRALLIVNDAATDPRVRDNLAVRDIGVHAYLGFPLMTEQGHVLGAFCAIDFKPRTWTTKEINLVRDFAALAVGQLEAATNREKMRAAFDVVIHDLKSPLGGVMMAAALMQERLHEVPENLHSLVEVIGESSTKALKLVDTLIRDDAKNDPPMCVEPAMVMEAILSRLGISADAKEITIHQQLEEGFTLSITPWAFEQMVENLVSNAIKYSPAGSRVWITLFAKDNLGHVHVRDEGPGFTAEDRKKMFRRYSCLSASPTANESSTGLGLSIVKRLADQHGGHIELMSGDGEPAEFRILIPLA